MRLFAVVPVLSLFSCSLAGVTIQRAGVSVPESMTNIAPGIMLFLTTTWLPSAWVTSTFACVRDDNSVYRWTRGIIWAQWFRFKYPILLEEAKEVADKLIFAWLGDNDIPYGFLNFTTNEAQTNIAEAGSLTLEWSTLNKYTQNTTYEKLATEAVMHIANLPAPLPGLATQIIDPTTGDFVGDTWGSGNDLYSEYLVKYARLSNTNDPIYIDTWKTAVDSSIHTLLKVNTRTTHTSPIATDGNILHVGSYLTCFYAGNWFYGGKSVRNENIVNYGLALNDGCWNTYASTLTGIGPESFAFSEDGNYIGGAAPTADQLEFYDEYGFYIPDSIYVLRPEVLESKFYAWRGDTKYPDRAASAIDSFNKYLAVPSGDFAGLKDVTVGAPGGYWDVMESFWFAEVLKYLYLTFDDPNHISLDEYVYNTECLPFKAPPALDSH
ncbi:alpha-1,2-Mannosidase [Mycena sanguinolenta]|uniref:alpha-1,2-Mannosidase n=1 Tax=Mycena sanguinolenta TaxID=230812 RepID=A0A8H6X7I4_9AGAR|nr:alpha-1,2-Mannosidase [Mycena sanguinolenta]